MIKCYYKVTSVKIFNTITDMSPFNIKKLLEAKMKTKYNSNSIYNKIQTF